MSNLTKQHLFVSGNGGYHTYRIPALLTTRHGAILAFCEGRKTSAGDAGEIDLLLRRSVDGGVVFTTPQVVVSAADMTCGNPAPVQDRDTGVIWLLFCQNLADGPEAMIVAGKASRTVWVTSSADDGTTWTPPREITAAVKRPEWTWYATGPCHGIQLQQGRLLIPCDHMRLDNRLAYAHLIYSDDHGRTWQIGGITDPGANESTVLETTDGWIYLNCRNMDGQSAPSFRAIAWSRDGGASFSPLVRDAFLPEPRCQASVCRYTDAREHGRNRVLFSNPARQATHGYDYQSRRRMTLRMSGDECRTWPAAKVLHEGPAAYSDICIAPDGHICCLYECGDKDCYERITLARGTLEWLTDGHEQ